MAPGRKTGGRTKGTPNKKTAMIQPLMEKLEMAGCDPVSDLLDVLLELTPKERADVYLDLLQYIYPKKRAVETTVDPALLDKIKALDGKSNEELLDILKGIIHTQSVSTES